MDASITFALNGIKSLCHLISDLRQAPELVYRIDSQVRQLNSILQVLQEKASTHILTPHEMAIWSENLQICNRILHRIRDILWAYARDKKSKIAFVNDVMFEFGPKGKLVQLHTDLEKSEKYFRHLAEIILPDSVLVKRLEGGGIPRDYGVMSIGQFARMSSK